MEEEGRGGEMVIEVKKNKKLKNVESCRIFNCSNINKRLLKSFSCFTINVFLESYGAILGEERGG